MEATIEMVTREVLKTKLKTIGCVRNVDVLLTAFSKTVLRQPLIPPISSSPFTPMLVSGPIHRSSGFICTQCRSSYLVNGQSTIRHRRALYIPNAPLAHPSTKATRSPLEYSTREPCKIIDSIPRPAPNRSQHVNHYPSKLHLNTEPATVHTDSAKQVQKLSRKPATPTQAASQRPAVPSAAFLTPNTTFSAYNTAKPPTAAQLTYANRVFTHGAPTFLFSSPKFRTLPESAVPEVAFLGRSNVGKSSLLNALLHRTGVQIANVSSKPGRTRSMNAFGVGGADGGVRKVVRYGADGQRRDRWIGRGGLIVLDMPGYGKSSREEWGREIVKYLSGRKQLRRTFLLVDAEHGVKPNDRALLDLLRRNGIAHQVVLSKIDKLVWPKAKLPAAAIVATGMQQLERAVQAVRETGQESSSAIALGDVLACSAERTIPAGLGGVVRAGAKLGVDDLRWAVLCAVGLECDEMGRRRTVDVGVAPEDVDDRAFVADAPPEAVSSAKQYDSSYGGFGLYDRTPSTRPRRRS